MMGDFTALSDLQPTSKNGKAIVPATILRMQEFQGKFMVIYGLCLVIYVYDRGSTVYVCSREIFKFRYNSSSCLIVDMFRPSGTPQYNPKFPKKLIKIDRIRIRDM